MSNELFVLMELVTQLVSSHIKNVLWSRGDAWANPEACLNEVSSEGFEQVLPLDQAAPVVLLAVTL